MELNLAMRSAHRRGRSCRLGRHRLDEFYGNFALRETRSSYFLNLLIRGLSTDEIEVEMDKERGLIVRGESYCKELGMVKWKCRLVSKTRKPFRIPEDVNVGATRGSFQQQQQHMLHVVMPKFTRQSRMSAHHVIHIHIHIHIHSSPRQLLKSQAAVKVKQSSSCSYYTSEVINKDNAISSSKSSSLLSNAEGKIQQYQRRRRRSINKITANSP